MKRSAAPPDAPNSGSMTSLFQANNQARKIPIDESDGEEQSAPMRGLGKKMKDLAAQRGYSDAKVAREAGLPQRTYSNYANDETEPDYATLTRICRVLGTTPNNLLGFDMPLPAHPGVTAPGLIEIGKTEFVSIARYDAALSAGPGSIIDPHAEPLGFHLVETQWLHMVTHAAPEFLALLRVTGDSMVPTLLDSDWVLIDRSQRRVTRQGIYALAVGEDAWIKRLTLDLEARKVRIISDNDRYPPQLLDEDQLHLIGRYLALVWRRSAA